MTSENYRCYCLDHNGLHDATWFSAATDEDAVAQITAKHPHGKCEIWEGQRLVAKLGFRPIDDVVHQSRRTIAQAQRVLTETSRLVAPQQQSEESGHAR